MIFPTLKSRELIAHRGASQDAPENSILAYKLASDKGFDWIEVDVQLTKDLIPVMIHDNTLDRTSYAQGYVNDIYYDTIKQIDASKEYPNHSGVAIPTLMETIEVCLSRNLGLILEMKPIEGADIVTANQVAKVVDEYWPKDNPNLIVSSFSAVSLIAFKKCLPNISLAFATVVPVSEPDEIIKMLDVSGFHLNYEFAIKYGISNLLESGAQVIVATVNDKKSIDQLFDMGVHGVMTDNSSFIETQE